jgi:long-chain acyl-CoA synthetase
MVRFGEREIPQAELKAQAALVAAALSASGVEHGDRVAIILRNEPSFLTLSAACAVMGAVPVPVNWHWHGAELRGLCSRIPTWSLRWRMCSLRAWI